jgi:hypothetical protein
VLGLRPSPKVVWEGAIFLLTHHQILKNSSLSPQPATLKMKNTHAVIHSIAPLLRVQIKGAERHGLSEIRISTARAREILNLAIAAEKEMEVKKPIQPRHFSHLDRIMLQQTDVMNEALDRIFA